MEMNRRLFLKSSGASLASVAVLASVPAIEGCNTSWIATAEKDIPTITTILESLLAIVADATGNGGLDAAGQAILNEAIKLAQGSLATLGAVIASYNSQSPTATDISKIDAALVAAQQNLQAILAIAGIKDTGLQASISAGVSLAITVIGAIQLLIPSSKAALTAKAAGSTAKVTLLTPSQIKQQYNTVVIAHGYAAHTI